SVAMCSGAATAMPPSLRKRWCSARYVGRARMLSPTQLRPITTVSLAICFFALSRPGPFPSIVHPQPQLRLGSDAAGDHVIDLGSQQRWIPFLFAQLINTNWLLELETMPGPVRNAKSEHNSRTKAESEFRGSVGGPSRAAEEWGE